MLELRLFLFSSEAVKVFTAIASIAASAYGSFKGWKKYKTHKQLKQGESLIEAHVKVTELMSFIRELAGSCRATLVQITNSGGIPCLGEQWHATTVRDVRNARLKDQDIEETFKEKALDQPTIHFIQKVIVNKEMCVYTKDIPEGSVLRKLHDMYGIKAERTIYLSSEKGAVWLLTLNWNYELEWKEDTPEFERCLEELRALILTHKSLREKRRD